MSLPLCSTARMQKTNLIAPAMAEKTAEKPADKSIDKVEKTDRSDKTEKAVETVIKQAELLAASWAA